MIENNKYHKTGQFRQAIKQLKNLSYVSNNNITSVTYIGTTKLHGTNASIIVNEDLTFSLHSKSTTLAKFSKEGELLESFGDNYGFVHEMKERMPDLLEIMNKFTESLKCKGILEYPVKFSGEWCGPGIQSGVGISKIDKKHWFIFAVKCGICWYRTDYLDHHYDTVIGASCVSRYMEAVISVDLTFPEKSIPELEKLTYEVEKECPVAKALISDNELIDEGLVWIPEDTVIAADTNTWFKTKGQKHSSSKVKKVASVDPDKIKSIEKFVEYAVTSSRLNQGLENIHPSIENTGKFIGWVSRDIYNEESDTLTHNNLTMKDVSNQIAVKAREFFLKNLL